MLKPGGKLISHFRSAGSGFCKGEWFQLAAAAGHARVLSFGIRRKLESSIASAYSFLFMTANGGQLGQITSLIEAGPARPVMDRVFPFEKTNEALA